MPALDGTGPNGQGPRTGRGFGKCPGTGGVVSGRPRGFGVGLGRRQNISQPYNDSAIKKELAEIKQSLAKLADKISKK